MAGGRWRALLLGAVVGALASAGCGGEEQAVATGGAPAAPSLPPPPATASSDPLIIAVGDIACSSCAQADTAALVGSLGQARPLAAILTLGDQAYPSGARADYDSWYAPSWGSAALRPLTHPVLGGHDYLAPPGDGTGYFDYFYGPGVATGPFGARGQGYYSFDVGAWHVVALNTSVGCDKVPCDAKSDQVRWLQADLASHPAACTLGFYHEPRFQQGATHGDARSSAALWETLLAAGADVVLNGHEHNYQQLGPMDA